MRPVPVCVLDLPTVRTLARKIHLSPQEQPDLAVSHSGVQGQHDGEVQAAATALKTGRNQGDFFLWRDGAPDIIERREHPNVRLYIYLPTHDGAVRIERNVPTSRLMVFGEAFSARRVFWYRLTSAA